jgi:hypothetical protein
LRYESRNSRLANPFNAEPILKQLKNVPLLKDHAFVAVVSNVPVPWLAPLGTIILWWLIVGIVLDASGLFFRHWFYVSSVQQVGRRAW